MQSEANARGELSASQKFGLMWRVWLFGGGALVFFVLALSLLGKVTLVFGNLILMLVIAIELGLLGAALWLGWQAAQTLGDVRGGRVEAGEGQVVWRRTNYRAFIQGRVHKLDWGLQLPPDNYRFYYMPRSRIVVNAERLGGALFDATTGAVTSAAEELRRALAQANHLNLGLLPELRLGQLPAAERQWRLGWAWLKVGGVWLASMAVWFLSCGLPLMVGYSFALERNKWWIVLVMVGTGLLTGGIALSLVGRSAWRITQDVQAGQVLMVARAVSRIQRQHGKSTRSYYCVTYTPLEFAVSETGYNALIDGLQYRVYYLPRSNTLLGIEPLEG